MPHGESWISYFLKKVFPSLYEHLEHSSRSLSWPVRDDGKTWLAGGAIELQHVFGALFVFLLIVVFAIVSARRNRDVKSALVPESKFNLNTVVELLVGTTYKMMSDIMGQKAAMFFLPLIGSCAFFILFSNLLGLIPGMLPPTDSLNTTVACAVVIFFATHIFGVREHGLGYFKHFFGPVRSWYWLPLMLLMFAIETISHAVRPVTLSLRLMANIYSDHLVLGLFLDLLGKWAYLPIPAVIMMLGTLVAVVQTLVFCILSTVYIAMAIEHSDH